MKTLYKAFGEQGEYVRDARLIHELPTPERRKAACREAASRIGLLINRNPERPVFFGTPVYLAFGLTKATAKTHRHASLLMTNGSDIPLNLLDKKRCHP